MEVFLKRAERSFKDKLGEDKTLSIFNSIKGYNQMTKLRYTEEGTVRVIRGCIIIVEGFKNCINGQVIRFGYGTMGAFISQKTPIKSRNDLFDVGLAGPIFGLIVALFFTVFGLWISSTMPKAAVPESLTGNILFSNLVFSSPDRFRILLFEAIAFLLFPNLGTNLEIILHPMALAGYIGLFLTGLNLIPIGQLDGGHVARSLVSEKSHRTLTYVCAFLMIFISPILALLVLLMYSQTGHAGPLDDLSSVTLSRKVIAALAVILAFLCLPLPFEIFRFLFPMFG